MRAGLWTAVICGALGLGACTQTTAAPPPGAALVPASLGLPGGSGCSAEIARFQAVLKSDVDTGNVNQGVYNRAEPEIARASAACSAGRDGEARSVLAATKSRFGYR